MSYPLVVYSTIVFTLLVMQVMIFTLIEFHQITFQNQMIKFMPLEMLLAVTIVWLFVVALARLFPKIRLM